MQKYSNLLDPENKPEIFISKIVHKGFVRIRVELPYEKEAIRKIKTVPGYRWSSSLKSWHVPYHKKSYQKLLELFPEIQIKGKIGSQSHFKEVEEKAKGKIMVEICKQTRNLNLYFDDTTPEDLTILTKDLPFVWDNQKKCWAIPDSEATRTSVRNAFKSRLFKFVRPNINQNPFLQKQAVIYISNAERFKIHAPYNWEFFLFCREIKGMYWKKKAGFYSLPFLEINYLSVIKRLEELSITYLIEKIENTDQDKKNIYGEKIEKDVKAYENKLVESNYSQSTVRRYSALFQGFAEFFQNELPEVWKEGHVHEYLRFLIRHNKGSIAYQVQVARAITLFFKKVLKVHIESKLNLVKKDRTVILLDETKFTRVLRKVTNLKHRCILLLVYAYGLSIFDVVNIRKSNIHLVQKRFLVKGLAKGRYVYISAKVTGIFEKYLDTFRPEVYLFEDLYGEPYHARNLKKVFKKYYEKVKL